jgi:hypothetical protein
VRFAAVAIACMLGIAAPAAASDADRPTPEAAYVAAVAAMRALDIPPYVTFHSAWTSTGAGFTIEQNGQRVVLEIGIGRAFHQHADYDLTFASAGAMITVTTPAGHLAGTGSHLLDPTWTGAYDILRYGLHGEPPVAADIPAATPAPASEPSGAATAAPVIASIVAIAPAFYAVSDGGSGACPNGDAGRVLSLRAFRDPADHPLTEVTIDATNDRFCSMRFNVDRPGFESVTGDYEIHFAQAGAYWLVSGGFADVSARVMGIAARRVVLRWENSEIATPSLPTPP